MFKCVKLYSNDETNNYVLHFFSNVRSTMYITYKSHTNTILSRKLWPEIKKKVLGSQLKSFTQHCKFALLRIHFAKLYMF